MNNKNKDLKDIFLINFVLFSILICFFSLIFITEKQYEKFNINESYAFSNNQLYFTNTRKRKLYLSNIYLNKYVDNITFNNTITGYYVWYENDNIFYSFNGNNYKYNKNTNRWENFIFHGLTNIDGSNIWSYNGNFYYSYYSSQYILNLDSYTWELYNWSGLTQFWGYNVWTDGYSVFYSDFTNTYFLNDNTHSWELYSWNGSFTAIDGNHIWSYNSNVYFSFGNDSKILNRSTNSWDNKTWNVPIYGDNIYSDGHFIYSSTSNSHYVLNGNSWISTNYTFSFDGKNVFTDGESLIFINSSTSGYKFRNLNKFNISYNLENSYFVDSIQSIDYPLLSGFEFLYYEDYPNFIYSSESIIFTYKLSLNYELLNISVTNATFVYNTDNNTLLIQEPTGDVIITIQTQYHIEDYNFISLIDAVISVPVDIFYNATNFEIFGINFYNLLTSTIVLFVIVFIIMKVFKG